MDSKQTTITIPYRKTTGMRLRVALGSGSYADTPLHASYDGEGIILEIGPDEAREYYIVLWDDIYSSIAGAVLNGGPDG